MVRGSLAMCVFSASSATTCAPASMNFWLLPTWSGWCCVLITTFTGSLETDAISSITPGEVHVARVLGVDDDHPVGRDAHQRVGAAAGDHVEVRLQLADLLDGLPRGRPRPPPGGGPRQPGRRATRRECQDRDDEPPAGGHDRQLHASVLQAERQPADALACRREDGVGHRRRDRRRRHLADAAGAAVLGTMCASTTGISARRSGWYWWKFDSRTRPRSMVMLPRSAALRP